MEKKELHESFRQRLIVAAVKTVAQYGLEGAKTRTIAEAAELNEAYIYKYFLDRDDLLEKAFVQADRNFFEQLELHIGCLVYGQKEWSDFKTFFNYMLLYALKDLDYAIFYIRYYYSASYSQNAMKEHGITSHKFSESFIHHFKYGVNVDALCHALFVLFLGYLMQLKNGLIADTKEDRTFLFNEMVNILKDYLAY